MPQKCVNGIFELFSYLVVVRLALLLNLDILTDLTDRIAVQTIWHIGKQPISNPLYILHCIGSESGPVYKMEKSCSDRLGNREQVFVLVCHYFKSGLHRCYLLLFVKLNFSILGINRDYKVRKARLNSMQFVKKKTEWRKIYIPEVYSEIKEQAGKLHCKAPQYVITSSTNSISNGTLSLKCLNNTPYYASLLSCQLFQPAS